MFSYFHGKVNETTPSKKISIEALVKEIKKDNPKIQEIRNLDSSSPDYTKTKDRLKRKLSYITPHCIVSQRNDDDIIDFTGYLYFDIDRLENAIEYKAELIDQYKDAISMICLSSSGRGLSILIKIENEITHNTFRSIREYVVEHIFKDLNLDPKPKSKSNAWYISHDPDCYFNPCAVIEIPEEYIHREEYIPKEVNKKSAIDNINYISPDILPIALFKYEFKKQSEVLNTLKFKTEVPIENRIFDLKPVEYCEVFTYMDYRIPLGKKKSTFQQIIHDLVYLNPEVDLSYIFSHICWLNSYRTVDDTAASVSDIERLFDWTIDSIKMNGCRPKTRIKYFHCRKNTIPPEEKKQLASKMISRYKRWWSIDVIETAKQYLREQKSAIGNINNTLPDILGIALSEIKVTQQEVCTLINKTADQNGCKGIGIRTIKKYWNEQQIDLEEEIRLKNESIKITYISKEDSRTES